MRLLVYLDLNLLLSLANLFGFSLRDETINLRFVDNHKHMVH